MSFNLLRRALDAEMRKATSDGVAIKSKMRERDPISEEDEALLWEKGILGCNSAKSFFRTIYFYTGKLFGLRSTEHRNLRYSNFSIDSESVTYDESVSKTYHGGLRDLKYKPRLVKHVCCAGKDVGHNRCIVKCYSSYASKIQEIACKVKAFQSKVDEKLIRDRAGHRSNALFSYEKSSLAQQMNVSNTLAPPDYGLVQVLISAKVKEPL